MDVDVDDPIRPPPPAISEAESMKKDDMEEVKPTETTTTTTTTMSPDEVESLQLYVDLLQKQLEKAKAANKVLSEERERLAGVQIERDRYRATVLSLAHQNKQLTSELTRSRLGISGKEERYLDARLQVQELKDALKLKEREIEELKAARDYMPTSDSELYRSYISMREVFDSLRSTLSCSLCFEPYSPNDAITLECGHTSCARCMKQWSDSKLRLYNLTTTPDCPECRTPGKHYVKVYLLEEVVRTVDRLSRYEREEEERKTSLRKHALAAETAAAAATTTTMTTERQTYEDVGTQEGSRMPTLHGQDMPSESLSPQPPRPHHDAVDSDHNFSEHEDDEVASLLIERRRHRYSSSQPAVRESVQQPSDDPSMTH